MIDNQFRSEITAVVIYGSHARGDADAESDLDVCVFTAEKTTVRESQITSLLPLPQSGHVSLTTYCEADLDAMLEVGSLFLWHLRLEGRCIFGKEYLLPQLASLRPFERHQSEIELHREIFDDITASVSERCSANEFDLALFFTIARNTCMVLAHKAGVPAFGRHSCYRAAARAFQDLPLDEATYLELSQWKLVYERGTTINRALPSHEEMVQLLTIVQRLLEYAHAETR